jgi:hypothetical protein
VIGGALGGLGGSAIDLFGQPLAGGNRMKTSFKTFLMGAVLAVAGVAGSAGMAAAAGAVDPVVGTWTLNAAKSKFAAGQELKSQTRTYTQDSDGISVSVTGARADGTAVSQQSTFKYDNKAYPWTGAADYDAISLKRVNGSTVTAVLMKAGKKVGTTTRSISGHGKVLTLSSKITGADGKPYSAVMVFDKQ